MGSFHVKIISDSDFDSYVVERELPVMLHFFAAWCAPCKMLSPVIESLARNYKSLVTVGSFDTEANARTPAQFLVRVLPTVLVFHRGKLVQRFEGSRSRGEYARFLDSLLALSSKGRSAHPPTAYLFNA